MIAATKPRSLLARTASNPAGEEAGGAGGAPLSPIDTQERWTKAVTPHRPSRPPLLLPLYATYGALQALDVVSTQKALANGAYEANPLLRGLSDKAAGTLAVKAGVTAGTIYLSERLWRKNRVAAVALMAVLNGAYASIVAWNYRQQ